MNQNNRSFNPHCLSTLLVTWSLLSIAAVPVSAQVLANAQVVADAQVLAGGDPAASIIAQASAPSQYPILHVNPQSGQDSGDGSISAPFRTITQALRVAAPNSIVKLAPGFYSAQSGEVFPIELKSSVTLQGEVSDRGQATVIQGSGEFLSKSFARQQVTLIGANRAGLQGVTVTNPHRQGYGLWIESSSPVISDNTFTGSGHDGISIVGNSAPIVANNYFYENGANGLTIYGTSRPEIKDNIFEKTGFGINIAQNAMPRLTGNRVTQNKDGIVVQGSATPILRGNVIDGNVRDGLVAIGLARPDLGTTDDQGNNTFLNNGGLDLNAQATSQVLPIAGNQLARTSGRVNANARFAASVVQNPPRSVMPVTQPISQPVPQPFAASPAPTTTVPIETPANAQELTFSRPDVGISQPGLQPQPGSILPKLSLAATVQSVPQPASQPVQAVQQPLAPIIPIAIQPGGGSRSLPVPKQATVRPIPTSMTFNNLILPTQGNPAINALPGAAAPKSAGNLLPVPGSNIPLGNVGELSAVPVWRQSGRKSAPVAQPRPTTVKFRVIVELGEADKLRAVMPGAFTTFSGGRQVMQAGAFGDQDKANQLLQRLNSQGINAIVEAF